MDKYMSDKEQGQGACFETPLKNTPKRTSSFKEVYLNSFKHHKHSQHKCSLCLLYDDDCSNFRCNNKTHYVCDQCACDWESDRLCPVCKNSSRASSRKDTSMMSYRTEQILEERPPRHYLPRLTFPSKTQQSQQSQQTQKTLQSQEALKLFKRQ